MSQPDRDLFASTRCTSRKETPMHRALRTLLSLAGVAVLMLLTSAAHADTLNVPSQYASIQAAIDAANPGDAVLIADGTYYEHNLKVFQNITIRSASDDPARCSIDALWGPFSISLGPVFAMVAADATIRGLTIAHG